MVIDVSDFVFLCNLINQLHPWAKNQKVFQIDFLKHNFYTFMFSY